MLGDMMTERGIDLSRALPLDGWMSPGELEWLARRAAEHRFIVELGCYLGRSTRALGDNTRGVVYAIDHWPDQAIYDRFLDNVSGSRVVPIREQHDRASLPLEVEIDFLFIDGDHDRAGEDIDRWRRRIRPGGLIAGHDIQYDPVRLAVERLLPGCQFVEGIWWRLL